MIPSKYINGNYYIKKALLKFKISPTDLQNTKLKNGTYPKKYV